MKKNGFTLIELLVAISIFSLISVMAFRGLISMIQARETLASESRKWRDISLLFLRIGEDLTQAAKRPVKIWSGLTQPEMLGNTAYIEQDGANLVLSRMGSNNQDTTRVGYRIKNGVIEMLLWPNLDQAPRTSASVYPLLSGVKEFKLRYMGINRGWNDIWPLPNQPLPRAVNVTVTLDSGEAVTRTFSLP